MNRLRSILGLVAVLLVVLPISAGEPLYFDMGTSDSPLRAGFTRITAKSAYSPDAGYGWRDREGLKEHHRSYSREWTYSESSGRKYPPEIYTNEITCDTVWSKEANAFLIDVPPGQYTVYLLAA